jgi:hypothetical protein
MFSNDDIIEQQLAIMRQIESDRNAAMAPSSSHAGPMPAYAYSAAAQHHEATEEDIQLIDLMGNPDIIRQQHELLARICIQQENGHRQTPALTDEDKKPSGDQVSRLPVASICSRQENRPWQHTIKTPPPIDKDRKPSSDRVSRLPSGKKVRIKGTLDTYKAIAAGNAALVQCPCCQTVLQVVSTAKNMLCPTCNQVSSMALVNKITGANSSTKADNVIARGLQQSEVDVAFARERAKIDRENMIMTKKR